MTDSRYNQRTLLKQTLAAVWTLFLSVSASSAIAAELPNILWITSEDNGPHLGCYGDSYAVTPNLDALAAHGMRYTNASSNAPVCAPARTTIISGLYPPSTGAEHMRSLVRLPVRFPMFPQLLREAGVYCTNNSKEDYNLVKPGKVWDQSDKKAHWKNRKDGQPFFAVFNYTISHESYIRKAIKSKNQIHDPAQVRVPAYHPDTPEVRQDWAQYYDRVTMMDTQVGKNLKELAEAGLDDDTIVFYYGDHGSGMPRNKRWLYNGGLNVPLIVYFPEKWKRLAPRDYQPGGTSDRLVSFIDLAPTVLSLMDIEPPKWMQGNAFAGKRQTKEPEFSYGFRGRMDERIDLLRCVRDKRYLYIRNYMPHRPYGQYLEYMFRTKTTEVWSRLAQQGKLNTAQARFWQAKPAEELYDLEADPDQVNNLANSPDHRAALQRLRQAQQNWEREIKDVGLLSEWEMHKRSADSTPYEMGHDPEKYDFEAVFAAAELASSKRDGALPELLKLLDSRDDAVRYWAAVGLLARERAGYDAAHERLVAALEDDSPMVRITVAESLGRYGDEKDLAAALEVLLQYADPQSDVFLGIAAWNVLDQLDERARPALDRIRSLGVEPANAVKRTVPYAQRLKTKTLLDLEGRSEESDRND